MLFQGRYRAEVLFAHMASEKENQLGEIKTIN